jgi:excinuclease ABC subunit C
MDTPPSDSGCDIIRAALARLDDSPGVYRMLDHTGKALYVGKAKSLKKRVANYTQLARLPLRLQRMVMQTASMEFVIATSEAEALLIEANLIKQLKPPFNILLRDDKSYPYISIEHGHPYPRIGKFRGAKKKGHTYFGPFASAGAVNQTLQWLQKAFLLRPCSDSYFNNRARPCLQYQIKRCSGPCVGKISESDYAALLGETEDFLNGKTADLQQKLGAQMQEASDAMRFEQAAALRDRIKALTQVQQAHRLSVPSVADADVIALVREGALACVQVFFYRAGQNYGNHASFLKVADDQEDAEVLESFIGQFYANHPAPPQLYASHTLPNSDVVQAALSLKEGRSIALSTPQRGEKREAVAFGLRNAADALRRRLSESQRTAQLLEGVQKLFGLPHPPKRIEVYDNSHTMGTHTLGGMIVAGAEGFMPKLYRRFNRKDATLAPGDDYGMMREMLRRRLQHREENWDAPDLLLIDGGAGQLSAVEGVLQELQLIIPVVAIAKGVDRNAGREQFFLPNTPPFQLPPDDPVLHYLQRLRDEAHRFAIGAHRQKRGKAMVASALDDIPGVGAVRKKALLHHFGSASALRDATIEDLLAVEGVHQKTAEQIYHHFHRA